jgi:putative addiction module antidote
MLDLKNPGVRIMIELRIVKVGNALGMRLPSEVLSRLQLADGDRVILTESPEGGYRLTPYDPDFERQMAVAEEGMRRYRNTLKALAE